VGASADRGARLVADLDALGRRIALLERASERLGAMTSEARAGRLLSGAGLHVSARDVMERSGIGPELAGALLDMALNKVRAGSERRLHATLFELPRRSSNDDPLS
jgi:hypothetical protein